MAAGDAYVFPGFLTAVLTQLCFPKSPTTFLTCFCRGERRKYAGKKSRLNRESNSQPPGHESNTLTTELPGRGFTILNLHVHVFLHIITSRYCNIIFFEDITPVPERFLSKLREYGYHDKPEIIVVPVLVYVLYDDSETGVN